MLQVSIESLTKLATLPYYQAPGVLKDAEGAVAIGDPIAWNTGTSEYIKYAPGATLVEDEAVGTGDGSVVDYFLANDYIQAGIVVAVVDRSAQVEGIDYVIDYKSGWIFFKVAPENTKDITATYTHHTAGGTAAGKAVGFVRIPGDSTDAAVAIEVVIGGAVKYSVVSAASNWDANVLVDLGAKYDEIADSVIF